MANIVQSTSSNSYPHPPWKRLYGALENNIHHGDLVTYKDLGVLMGVDARTTKGRQQFLRCAKEFLLHHSLHFENVRLIGYRIVQPNEHIGCANRQVRKARRRIRFGMAIGTHVDFEQLTAEQRKFHTDALLRMSRLEETVTETLREVRKLAVASVQQERLPPGMGQGKEN